MVAATRAELAAVRAELASRTALDAQLAALRAELALLSASDADLTAMSAVECTELASRLEVQLARVKQAQVRNWRTLPPARDCCSALRMDVLLRIHTWLPAGCCYQPPAVLHCA